MVSIFHTYTPKVDVFLSLRNVSCCMWENYWLLSCPASSFSAVSEIPLVLPCTSLPLPWAPPRVLDTGYFLAIGRHQEREREPFLLLSFHFSCNATPQNYVCLSHFIIESKRIYEEEVKVLFVCYVKLFPHSQVKASMERHHSNFSWKSPGFDLIPVPSAPELSEKTLFFF